MVLFFGQYDRTLDSGGTLFLPGDYRRQLAAEQLCLMLGPNKRLWLYPESVFRSLVARSPHEPAEDGAPMFHMLLGTASLVRIDSRGRVRLPGKLVRLGALGREITVVGVRDHFELWPRDQWQRQVRETLASIRSAGFLAP